jgi:hypothetical protein
MHPAASIGSFEEQLRKAKRVPLTNQVRVNKNEMDATLEEMRTGFSRAGLTQALALVGRLDEQIQNAKPVPLTDEVRLDPDEVRDILDQLRASASPATN